jgi:hypothetical protein
MEEAAAAPTPRPWLPPDMPYATEKDRIKALKISEILRNLSFMPENEALIADHKGLRQVLRRVLYLEYLLSEEEKGGGAQVAASLAGAPLVRRQTILVLSRNALETFSNVCQYLVLGHKTAQWSFPPLIFYLGSDTPELSWAAVEAFKKLTQEPDNEIYFSQISTTFYDNILTKLCECENEGDVEMEGSLLTILQNIAKYTGKAKRQLARHAFLIGKLIGLLVSEEETQENGQDLTDQEEEELAPAKDKELDMDFQPEHQQESQQQTMEFGNEDEKEERPLVEGGMAAVPPSEQGPAPGADTNVAPDPVPTQQGGRDQPPDLGPDIGATASAPHELVGLGGEEEAGEASPAASFSTGKKRKAQDLEAKEEEHVQKMKTKLTKKVALTLSNLADEPKNNATLRAYHPLLLSIALSTSPVAPIILSLLSNLEMD